MLGALVGAGDGGGCKFQAFLHAVQSGRNHGGHRQVGVHVGTGATRFQSRGFWAACNHAETGGAVVHAPRWFDGCPEAIDQTFVAVDGGPDHGRKFHHAGDLTGQVALKELAHLARILLVEEEVVFAVRQALVNVSAAARQRLVRLGHETGHDAKAGTDLLGAGLEQNGAVGLFQSFAEANGGLVDTRASLGVQAFHRHAKGEHLVHDGVEKFPVLVDPQQRITKHAGRQRLWGYTLFGSPTLWRFQKVVPLELHAGHDLEAHFLCAFEHLFQGLARAKRVGRTVGIDKLPEEKIHVVVPRHFARGIQVESRQCVGESMLPAGHLGVVVGDIHHVPAQHHIAEAKAAFGVGLCRAQELVPVQVLAAQDAVDITDCNFNFGGPRFLDFRYSRVNFDSGSRCFG